MTITDVVPTSELELKCSEFVVSSCKLCLGKLMTSARCHGYKKNCHGRYIEVTETALITNISIAKLNMKRLRKHGIKFAIDDFGTGYASISMLRDISVERIKLDKTYIENIQNEVDQALVKTVVWMSKALNVELVAEGIESEEQMNALAGLGCKLGQGLWLE